MDICGHCGKSPCTCLALSTEHPSEGATGEALTQLAKKYGLLRGNLEPDTTLRSRLQLTIIHGRPYRAGIPGKDLLTKMAARVGVHRSPGETDSRLLARWLLKVHGPPAAPTPAPDRISLSDVTKAIRLLPHLPPYLRCSSETFDAVKADPRVRQALTDLQGSHANPVRFAIDDTVPYGEAIPPEGWTA